MRVTYDPCEFGPTECEILEAAERVLRARKQRMTAHIAFQRAAERLADLEKAFTEVTLSCPTVPYGKR